MELSLTGILAWSHKNNYSTLGKEIVVVELGGLYHYWILQGAGAYLYTMTSHIDLTTIDQED